MYIMNHQIFICIFSITNENINFATVFFIMKVVSPKIHLHFLYIYLSKACNI
jgi:hypothetical protein